MKFVPPPERPTATGRRGFTLIELLVSMAVLGLVLILVVQIVNSASQVTNTGNKRSDADSQARQILDRMSLDFARMVKRSDVDFYYLPSDTITGNDQIAFYSESTGYYPTSGTTNNGASNSEVSLVGYMITTNTNMTPNQPQLVRLSRGLVWNTVTVSGTAPIPMVYGFASGSNGKTLTTTWPGIADGTDQNYQIIGTGVYRLAFAFIRKDGTISNISSSLDPTLIPTNISAVIVAIAILDNNSRKIVASTSSYQKMIQALGNVTLSGTFQNSTVLMSSVWNAAVNNGNTFATSSGIPEAAASQVRIYQRIIYLNQ